jgi:hypothetical protein
VDGAWLRCFLAITVVIKLPWQIAHRRRSV